MEMLTDKGEDGEYVIPRIIYSDAYASEMVAYADLILPDTTYLERHDCISLLDRPISRTGRGGRCDPLAGDRAGPRRARLPVGAARPWRAAGPAGDGRTRTASAKFTRLCRLHREPPAPARRRAADGLSRRMATRRGGARRTRTSLTRYIDNGGFYQAHVPDEAAFYKPWNAAYQDWAVATGLLRDAAALSVLRSGPNRCAGSSWRPRDTGIRQPPDAPARAAEAGDGPAADLVRALRR